MKIMQIMPGRVWGGAEQVILDLSKALSERGHEVIVYVRRSPAVIGRMERELPFRVLPFAGTYDVRAVRTLARALREDAADIVHVHDAAFVPMAVAANRMAGGKAKVVFTRHIARRSRTAPWLRWAFRRLHRVVFVSRLSMDLWREANPWMPESRCVVVHNSIPGQAETLSLPTLRRQLGAEGDCPVLMFTGRVRRSKGCMTMVKALAGVRGLPFRMVFVGKCKPERYGARLLAEAERLGIGGKVRLWGFTADVRSLVREADIALAPSIVREACPLSPMEFMQAGKCVITTDNGGQTEYIKDGETGMIVPPDDAEALSAAIRRAVEDAALRRRIGENARSHFENEMSYPVFIGRMLAVYGCAAG